jgi:hypothetical protein
MLPRLSLVFVLLACASLAQAEVLTRTHADGTTSTIVPAPYVGPPAPLARGVAWPFFPYHTDLWRLRTAAQQAAQQEQVAQLEQLRIPPVPSLVIFTNPDGSRRLVVHQTVPSLAVDGDAVAQLRQIERERTDQAYAESLERVKQDPSCADCRQQALELGRQRARLHRDDGKVTTYDEAAIANDLNAVSGTGTPR